MISLKVVASARGENRGQGQALGEYGRIFMVKGLAVGASEGEERNDNELRKPLGIQNRVSRSRGENHSINYLRQAKDLEVSLWFSALSAL